MTEDHSSPANAEALTGTRWHHLKRGTTYDVVGVAKLQTAMTGGLADETPMVVYRNEATHKLSVRAFDEFFDGRFERITPPANADTADKWLPEAPQECPCCGSELESHNEESTDEYEAWQYACGLSLGRGVHIPFTVFEDCDDATGSVVEKYNRKLLTERGTVIRAQQMTDRETLSDANWKDAEEFCKGAFGPFVLDVSQYTKIVAGLMQRATDRALMPKGAPGLAQGGERGGTLGTARGTASSSPEYKSAPVLRATHNSGEGDPSVMPDCVGADTAIQPQRTREAALEAAALDFVAKVERGEARSKRSYQAFKRALSITRPDDPPQCAPDREALVRAIQLSYARKDLEPTSATTLALYREDAENAADAVLALTRPEQRPTEKIEDGQS